MRLIDVEDAISEGDIIRVSYFDYEADKSVYYIGTVDEVTTYDDVTNIRVIDVSREDID